VGGVHLGPRSAPGEAQMLSIPRGLRLMGIADERGHRFSDRCRHSVPAATWPRALGQDKSVGSAFQRSSLDRVLNSWCQQGRKGTPIRAKRQQTGLPKSAGFCTTSMPLEL
jgi:hypothetical protein